MFLVGILVLNFKNNSLCFAPPPYLRLDRLKRQTQTKYKTRLRKHRDANKHFFKICIVEYCKESFGLPL